MQTLLAIHMLAGVLLAQATPELVVSVGHAGGASRATFVGSYLATASWSNVALVDLSSGLTVAHLPQGSLVQALEASPAGDMLAVGACGHAIQLWNVNSRTLVRRLTLTQECAESVSFSPDGAFLATGAYGCCAERGGLQVWDVRSGKLARTLAQGSGIRRVVFSGDGRWLAAVDDKGKATVFEWPSGRALRSFAGLETPGYAVASPDGRYLSWLGEGLRVWDVTSGDEVQLPGARTVHIHDAPPDGPERRWSEQRVLATTVEFLNDGRLAYIDGSEMFVRRLPDGPQQVTLLLAAEREAAAHMHIMSGRWLKIRRDGVLLAGESASGTIVWDLAASVFRDVIAPALTSPESLHWSSAGIVVWADRRVRSWDDWLGKPAAVGRHAGSASSLAFRRDGARLAIAGDSSVSVLDLENPRTIRSRALPSDIQTAVAFSSDGSRLAFTSAEGFRLFDANLRPGRLISPLEWHTIVEHAAFSPDGRWLAAGLGGPNPTLRVWSVAGSGTPVTLDTGRLTYGPQPPAFSGDSRRLASFRQGSALTIWSTTAWTVERTWTLPGTGRALAFAPEGSRLAIASDGEAAIWDADTGHKEVTFSTPGSAKMQEIAWSRDGRRVVTSADDGVIRFWSASEGRLLASLYVMKSEHEWLLVTPDGRVDGSERALARLVVWRVGDRVTSDRALTERHHVRGLWRSLRAATPRR